MRDGAGTAPTTPTPIRSRDRAQLAAQPARLGGYRIYERLGAGGQACVYRARRIADPDAGDVALKRLHPHLTADLPAVQAFGREARIAYLLDHPVIRRVFSLCREPDELFMIMEYVDGVPLTGILKRASAGGRPLPLHGVLTVLYRLCGALHHAHELVDERGAPAGLVHRDVSPSNVIVTTAGRLKLIDMGIARSQAADHATNSGLIKGKYGYMAPEVLGSAPFDRRADIFSAGVVAWELLTLCKLFPVSNPPVDLEQVRARPIDAPSRRNPGCPPELDAVVLRALATDPGDRWATGAAMAAALHAVAVRLGEPLVDSAIAELMEVLVEPDNVSLPVRPVPRSRLARGTPAELPTTMLPLVAAPPVAAPGCVRCRRARVLGALGGSLATMLVVTLASVGWRAVAPPAAGPGAAVATSAPSVDAGARVPTAGPPASPSCTGERYGTAASVRELWCDLWRAPALATASVPPAPAPPPATGPLVVTGAEVTWLDGPAPRSRSSSARYRAQLCIDEQGAVRSVAVLAGPKRLEARIARALRRWRYLPYHARDGARAVCFDVESRLQRPAGRG